MEFDERELHFNNMENLSIVSDDFLSNGFHQFYAEFNEELDFEYTHLTSSWENPVPTEEHNYFKQEVMELESYSMSESLLQTTFDLDYILMDLPYSLNNNNICTDLPELTPLCNDSCAFFLKESAENLKYPLDELQSPIFKDPEPLKTLKCDFQGCGKTYAKPTHLKAHLKRHMNDKPYICQWPECKWRFSRSDELARHRRSHLGIKPYKCCFCTKSFARSDHLTKHRRVHEKKFIAMNKTSEIVWPVIPRGRPGRKPKNKTVEKDSCNSGST